MRLKGTAVLTTIFNFVKRCKWPGILIVLAAVFFVLLPVYETRQNETPPSSGKVTEAHYPAVDISEFRDGFNHARYRYKDSVPPWKLYAASQILGIAGNMICLQNPDGGWAKNLDFQRIYTEKELAKLQEKNRSIKPVSYGFQQERGSSTLDNRNIYPQVRYLCRVYNIVKNTKGIGAQRYLDSATRAVHWILNAQHPASGGFTGCDVFGITYNDDVMTGTLRLLRDIANGKDELAVFPEEIRNKAKAAYSKGVQCILRNQITVTCNDGTKLLTAWCQQYSHKPPFPAIWAREFEPPAISSSESYGVLSLLMEDPEPSEELKKAIRAGCEFFNREDVRIRGKKIVINKTEPVVLNGRNYTTDRIMVDDVNSSDLWARFYALDAGFDVVTGARKTIRGTYPPVLQPVWCDMGCIYRKTYNDLSRERRNGYDYVNNEGIVLLKAYEKWKEKHLL